jgi:membrane protein implicated in regulation of membrane protease activity
MSFAGAYGRTMNWLWRGRSGWVKAAISWWAIPLVLGLWWLAIVGWYMLSFMVFGIFVIPWRLLRRSSRKQKRQNLQHQEMLNAINDRRN